MPWRPGQPEGPYRNQIGWLRGCRTSGVPRGFPPGKLPQGFTGVILLEVVAGLQALKLYPTSAYQLVISGSEESLHSIAGGLQHKALILSEALALESRGSRNNELAYTIRTPFLGKDPVEMTEEMLDLLDGR